MGIFPLSTILLLQFGIVPISFFFYFIDNLIIRADLKIFDLILLNFIVFNATFSNISAILWRLVLVVEEAGVLGENPPTMGKQQVNIITCGCESSAPFLFVIYKAGYEPTPYW